MCRATANGDAISDYDVYVSFRLQRQIDDLFPPIRDIWEMLMVSVPKNTLLEQMLSLI